VLPTPRFPLDAVDVGAGRSVDDYVRLRYSQGINRGFALCQIDRDVDAGIGPRAKRDNRRP
jgi:hypothetical protein